MSDSLRSVVEGDLAQLARKRKLRVAALVTVVLLLICGIIAMRPPAQQQFGWRSWWPAAVFSLSGVMLLSMALGLRLPGRNRLGIACGALLAGGMLLLASTAMPDASSGGDNFNQAGLVCALHGSQMGIVVMIATLLLGFGALRRFAPTGALIGTGAGLISLATLHLSCSMTGMAHLMVWHGLVLLAFGCLTTIGWRLVDRFVGQPEPPR